MCDGCVIPCLGEVCSCITALGTVLASVIALYGPERVVRMFKKSKMKVQKHELNVSRVLNPGNKDVRYFYLNLTNETKRVEQNVRICIVSSSRKRSGEYKCKKIYPVPLQLLWSPAELTSPIIDVVGFGRQIIDFMSLEDDGKGRYLLKPLFYVTPNNFDDFLKAGDSVQFELEVSAKHYRSKALVEVSYPSVPGHTLINDVGNDITIDIKE